MPDIRTLTELSDIDDETLDDLFCAIEDATTVDDVDAIEWPWPLTFHERRGLFAYLRYPGHTPDRKYPLLAELNMTPGIYADHPEHQLDADGVRAEIPFDDIDALWWPARIRTEPLWNGHGVHVDILTGDGRWMSTFTVYGARDGLSEHEGPAPAIGDGRVNVRVADIVEAERTAGLPGRPSGRPPATAKVLRGMTPRKRMGVAVKLCIEEEWRQVDAARYCGVTTSALNRRVQVRRRELAASR